MINEEPRINPELARVARTEADETSLPQDAHPAPATTSEQRARTSSGSSSSTRAVKPHQVREEDGDDFPFLAADGRLRLGQAGTATRAEHNLALRAAPCPSSGSSPGEV